MIVQGGWNPKVWPFKWKLLRSAFLYTTLYTSVNTLKNEIRAHPFLHSLRTERVKSKEYKLPSRSKHYSKQFHIYYNCMLLFLWNTLHISHLPSEKRTLNIHWQKKPYTLTILKWTVRYIAALQVAIILVTMASGKNIWWPKFWRKSPIGDQQIKRETCWKNYQ